MDEKRQPQGEFQDGLEGGGNKNNTKSMFQLLL